MGLLDKIYFGEGMWDYWTGFCLRTVLKESANWFPDKTDYQRIFTIFYLMGFFVLAQGYSGKIYLYWQAIVFYVLLYL
jgi:hypothetical protein